MCCDFNNYKIIPVQKILNSILNLIKIKQKNNPIMHKLPIGYIPGKGLPYDKKIKKNPKYANVKGRLKTGKTVKNYKVVSNQYIKKRKGEKFMRIKPSTLIKLL